MNTIPTSILALVLHPSHYQGDPRHQDVLRLAISMTAHTNTSVHVTAGDTTYRAEVTDHGTVAFAYKKGDEFAKSARRWCERFAKGAAGGAGEKPRPKAEKTVEEQARSARLATPRTEAPT